MNVTIKNTFAALAALVIALGTLLPVATVPPTEFASATSAGAPILA